MSKGETFRFARFHYILPSSVDVPQFICNCSQIRSWNNQKASCASFLGATPPNFEAGATNSDSETPLALTCSLRSPNLGLASELESPS
jgi:hypothetical protein